MCYKNKLTINIMEVLPNYHQSVPFQLASGEKIEISDQMTNRPQTNRKNRRCQKAKRDVEKIIYKIGGMEENRLHCH